MEEKMATSKKSKKKNSSNPKNVSEATPKPVEKDEKLAEEVEEEEQITETEEEVEKSEKENKEETKEEIEEAEVVEKTEADDESGDKKENKEETAKVVSIKAKDDKKWYKGFFDRKFDATENILTIFKTPRIYGALLGEMIGTLLLSVLLLTLGVQPLYMVFGTLGITIAVFALSGANLNPLITVGMMASRRMSAIRGVLYILAQVLGAWFGLLIVNAFRLGSGTEAELPKMMAITGETFWAVAMVEFVGAIMLAFFFARALHYKKSVLTFALTVASGLTFVIIFGIVVSQFFELTSSYIFNPAIALMYQILPSTSDSFGQLMGDVALALAAYIVLPMLGGAIGFFVSDLAARLAGVSCCCACEQKK